MARCWPEPPWPNGVPRGPSRREAAPSAESGQAIYLTLATLWGYAALVLISSVGFAVQCAVFVLSWPFDRQRLLCGRCFRASARLAVQSSWLWRFDVHGPRRYPAKGGAVVVSNHESHLDAFLISSLGWEMKWLAKRSLFFLPVIGWSMWLAGDVAIRRGERASMQLAMAQLARYLRAGVPVCLFPEGTRATDVALQPFKTGAFRLAISADVPVVPLAVAGTRSALSKHSWRFGRSRALVQVGEPIDVAAIKAAHLLADGSCDVAAATVALAALARARIAAMRTGLEGRLAS